MNNKSEIEAFTTIHSTLSVLDDETRRRVLSAVSLLLGIEGTAIKTSGNSEVKHIPAAKHSTAPEEAIQYEDKYEEFAELFAAAQPTSNPYKALVAGYWLQVHLGRESFSSHDMNKELNNLGHKIGHTPSAFAPLVEAKPQLVLQLKKSGTSKQARKTYKLSKAGISKVESMLNE